MSRMKKVFWFIFGCLLLLLPTISPASAATGGVTIPPGFRRIDSTVGIDLYVKNYPGGSPDYVQVIDLSQGASLKPLHGSIADPGAEKGVYGGNDAHFRSQSLAAYWQELTAQDSSAFCVINGQFFYMLEYPTRLPFPLKVDGQIITDGYGIKDFPDQKLMLELWPGKADIVPLSKEALYTSTAPDIIAGLAEDAPKAKKRFTGRTFIGLAGENGTGNFETLMVFNTQTARQVDAANVLKDFGAQKVMMLDGGGSTQLICSGKSYIYSDRLVPQAIGIIAGVPGMAQPAADLTNFQQAVPSNAAASNLAAGEDAKAAATLDNQALADKPASQDSITTTPDQSQPTPREQTQMPIQADPPNENQVIRQKNSPTLITTNGQVMLPVLFSSPPIARIPSGEAGAVNAENQAASPTTQASPALTGSAVAQQPAETHATPVAAEQTLTAGISPVHLDDVLLVPASMAPIVMFLFLIIFKFRGRQG